MRPDIPSILCITKLHITPPHSDKSPPLALPCELSGKEAMLEKKLTEMFHKEMKIHEKEAELAKWEKSLAGVFVS